MLTVLNIEKQTNNSLKEKISSLIIKDKIDAEIKDAAGLSVLYINYNLRRGNINYEKIYNECIGRTKTILCSEDIDLFNSRFKRFDDNSFKIKMMENYISNILDKCDADPSATTITYFDKNAEHPGFVIDLLKYTSSLNVITDMPRFYENEAERINNEYGVNISVYSCKENMALKGIVISPDEINIPLQTTRMTVVFTTKEPAATVPGIVITDYQVIFPEEYKELIDEKTDKIYFLSALYSIYDIKKLGDIIPFCCKNKYESYTDDHLIKCICSSK